MSSLTSCDLPLRDSTRRRLTNTLRLSVITTLTWRDRLNSITVCNVSIVMLISNVTPIVSIMFRRILTVTSLNTSMYL